MTMLPRNRTKVLPGIEPRLMPWPTSKSGTTNKQLLQQETVTKSLTDPEVGEETEDVVVVQEMVEDIAVKEEEVTAVNGTVNVTTVIEVETGTTVDIAVKEIMDTVAETTGIEATEEHIADAEVTAVEIDLEGDPEMTVETCLLVTGNIVEAGEVPVPQHQEAGEVTHPDLLMDITSKLRNDHVAISKPNYDLTS